MSNAENRTVIETVGSSGKGLKLAIKTPGHKVLQEAQMIYSLELTKLIRCGASDGTTLLSRQQLDRHLNELEIWTDEDAKHFMGLQLELRSLELELDKGGIKLSEARKIALKMKGQRAALLILYHRRSQFEGITMESMADNKKFKFLLTKCVVVDETDSQFFADIEDYEQRQNEQSAVDAATALAGKVFGYDKNTESNLSENKWLKQYKFADADGNLINHDGQLIDVSGHLVNKDGRLINDNGDLVDNQGRLVNENGDFIVDFQPFLDDETGEPLVDIKKKVRSKSSKKKRKNSQKV